MVGAAVPAVALRGAMQKPSPYRYAGGLLVLALTLHVGVLLLVTQFSAGEVSKPGRAELAMEFVKPPEPPKAEPPKPQPPKPPRQLARQPAPTVPPIETAPPEVASDAAPTGEVVAAPVAGLPVPEPELPVTPATGHAGYLNNPSPDYPAIALRQGWEGTVLLRVRVLSSGKVESVEVKKTSGRKLLDDEAIRAVRSWLFSPSKRGDIAIDGWATVPIEFKLDA